LAPRGCPLREAGRRWGVLKYSDDLGGRKVRKVVAGAGLVGNVRRLGLGKRKDW